MGHKAAEITCNINKHLVQELLTNIQCNSGSRSFAEETWVLKMRSTMAGHWRLTTTNWEDHQSWSSYNCRRSCLRTQHQPLYSCLAFEANWKGEKWTDHKSKKKKKSSFWSVVFCYPMQEQQTISWLHCDIWWKVDFIPQLAMTSSVVRPRRSSKTLPKAKLAPKKVMITVWWSAANLIHYSFLSPSEDITSETYAQQINEMHWKLQRL